jgi:hypothetical protein
VLLAAALSGCVGPQGVPNADRSYSAANAATGMLATSVTVSGYTPGSLWLQLVRAGDSAVLHSIPVNVDNFGLDWNPGTDGTGRAFRGRLAAIELPAGRYEVGRWVMTVANRAAYMSNARIGTKFSVRAGEVVYLGNIHLDIQNSASASLPWRVDVNDQRKRDLALLGQKYPALKLDGVRMEIDARDESPATETSAPRVRMEDLDGLIRPR